MKAIAKRKFTHPADVMPGIPSGMPLRFQWPRPSSASFMKNIKIPELLLRRFKWGTLIGIGRKDLHFTVEGYLSTEVLLV